MSKKLAIYMAASLLGTAGLQAAESMAGAKVGLSGGMGTALFREKDKDKTSDVREGILGGDINLCGGYSYSMGGFVIGAEVGVGWNMFSAEENKEATVKDKKELGMGASVSAVLGADMHTFMPFVRVGYAYNGFTVEMPSTDDATKKEKKEQGLHCLRWGLGVDARVGPVVVGVEGIQDIAMNKFKLDANKKDDEEHSFIATKMQVRVLYAF